VNGNLAIRILDSVQHSQSVPESRTTNK